MSYMITSFLVAFFATLLIVRSSLSHGHLSADHDLDGPQKFHARPVPRIGGVGVMVAILMGIAVAQVNGSPVIRALWLLCACSLPAFVFGVTEDLTKGVSPRRRLLATAVSGSLAIWLLDSLIVRTGIPGIDYLTGWPPFAVLLTVFAVSGVANAINIIDGFNGLASMCVLMMVLALGYVAFQVGDDFVLTASLIIAGAVFGFFVWNFPGGAIFLGDGGAYLLGFLLGQLSIQLVHRNLAVSPLCPLLLCAYPIFETVFTVYRRKVVRGVAAGLPDGIHLHTLIHRRLVRSTMGGNMERRLRRRNSMTSPYLWLLCSMSIIPSVLWWNRTGVLAIFLAGFVSVYVWIYSRIVRFNTPRWMILRRE